MLKRLLFGTFIAAVLASSASAYSLLDYFTDHTKPIISSEFRTDQYHKGKVTVPFLITEDETSVRGVSVYLDKADVTKDVKFGVGYSKNKYTFDSEELRDGPHILTIIAEDSSRSKNRAIQEMTINIDNNPPLVRFVKGGGEFAQAKTGIIYFYTSEPDVTIEGVFQGKDFRAYRYGRKLDRAVIGFSIDDPANVKYPMWIRATDRAGNISEYRYKIFVAKSPFRTVSFILKPKKAVMLMPDTIRLDWKSIEDVVVKENDNKYFRGGFIFPTKGRVTMLFGTKEIMNGEESGRHRGLDIANEKGTPVWASNSGIVRLSERLPAHGNCVVIDHGQGIYTYYAHLSKLLVNAGTWINKGQILGLMGMTGVATGPHLHFSVSLHNLRVDPQPWLDGVVTN